MEEREITSGEDVEELLTPTEPTRIAEETKLDNLMRIIIFIQLNKYKHCLLYTSRCV